MAMLVGGLVQLGMWLVQSILAGVTFGAGFAVGHWLMEKRLK